MKKRVYKKLKIKYNLLLASYYKLHDRLTIAERDCSNLRFANEQLRKEINDLKNGQWQPMITDVSPIWVGPEIQSTADTIKRVGW